MCCDNNLFITGKDLVDKAGICDIVLLYVCLYIKYMTTFAAVLQKAAIRTGGSAAAAMRIALLIAYALKFYKRFTDLCEMHIIL